MFSRYSVKKPLTVVLAALMVVLLGVISFTKMRTDLLPEMDLPYVAVVTVYAGASPETFTVDGSGAAIEVTLNYTKVVQQLDSVVTFHHLCDGAAITGDTQQELAPNTYNAADYQAAVEGAKALPKPVWAQQERFPFLKSRQPFPVPLFPWNWTTHVKSSRTRRQKLLWKPIKNPTASPDSPRWCLRMPRGGPSTPS